MKMKVAIDLSPLYSEHQYRGIGFYTKRLVGAIQLVARKQKVELELVKSTDRLRFLQVDLIHYPYFSPFFLTLPPKPLAPSVVTIHDLILVKYPDFFPSGVKGKVRWQIQKRRLKKVKAVVTDSQIWRLQIADLTGFPEEKIFSVPLAAGNEFKLIKDKEILNKIKQKYQLSEKFVLYVGDVNWNKNIPGLIKAFAKFRFANWQLVLVGKAFLEKSLKETQAIFQLVKSLGLNDKIRCLGFIATGDLVAIYNLASVYCQPSFDEGFGLPLLEAMVCGCPVVTSKRGSLPEIAGQAAVFVDPEEPADIAGGIKKAIQNRQTLVEKGLKQAQKFSWQKTAEQTIEIYEKSI